MMPTILSTALLDEYLVSNAQSRQVILDTVPFINVQAVSEQVLQEQVAGLGRLPVTAVFTSANAVKAIAGLVEGVATSWSVYCIGNATRDEVLKVFDGAAIKGIADNAAGLAEVIKGNEEKELIFFCGDKRLGILGDILRAHGIKMQEIVVYQTKETPVEVERVYDGILFFSPSAVSSFFSVNRVGPHTVLFAIGNTTAEAIKGYTGNTVVVCNNVSKEQVVADAIQYFKNGLKPDNDIQ